MIGELDVSDILELQLNDNGREGIHQIMINRGFGTTGTLTGKHMVFIVKAGLTR